MEPERKKGRRTAALALFTAAACALAGQSALAEDTGQTETETTEAAGPSTEVWLDVVKVNNEDRISVTVPVACGFVVKGSTDTSDTTEISVQNGTLLLPNVRVDNDGGAYQLSVFGTGQLPVRNYSTKLVEEDGGTGTGNSEDGTRTGLAVTLGASVRQEENSAWTPVADAPGTSETDKKHYRLSLDGKKFSVAGSTDGIVFMDGTIAVAAPPAVETGGWTAAGTADTPSEHTLTLDAEVGGVSGHYGVTEESVKVGVIVWTVQAQD